MRRIFLYSLLIFNLAFLKNLALHDYDNPSANHILDTEIIEEQNILIVSGMLGGIEFYDISNPQILNHLNNLTLSGGGSGGGGTKPNCIVVSNMNYAYVTTNQGLGIIQIYNGPTGFEAQYLGIVPGTNGYTLENLDVFTDVLAVAAHEDGVLIFDITNATNPELINTIPGENVWAVDINDNGIYYVADESVLKIYSYNSATPLTFLDSFDFNSNIKDIKIIDESIRAYIALGSDGVAIIEYGTPENNSINILGSYDTSAMANRLDLMDDGKIVVSDWDDIEVLEWDGVELNLVGYKNTTRRTMAVSAKDNFIYSGEWASVQVFEYGEIDGPDVDLSTYELNYPYVENGDSIFNEH